MIKITLLGREYPYRMTMGALLRFRELAGKDASEVKDDDIMSLIYMIWCGVKAGCSVDGIPFELEPQQFADALEPDEFTRFIREVTPRDVKKNDVAGSPR